MTRSALFEEIKKKQSFLCIGLDTDIALIPKHLLQYADPVLEFNKQIIEATKDICISYKPNTAFYETEGSKGWETLKKTFEYIPENIFKIADAKRGDIGNTSQKYAEAFFKNMNCDAVTVSPYLGADSVKPFLKYAGKWTIILGLTSNEGSNDFQNKELISPARHDKEVLGSGGGEKNSGNSEGQKLYETVIQTASGWGTPENTMFVVGATHPEALTKIRNIIPDHYLLVPGVGAQGGSLTEIIHHGMNSVCGLIINSSRGIIYAGSGKDFAEKAREAALLINAEMKKALELTINN